MTNPLITDNHLQLARTLVDMMRDDIRSEESLGGHIVADKIIELENIVWPENGEYLDAKTERRAFREVLHDLKPEHKEKLFEAYARMGHLYEIAGLAARHHFFQKQKEIPGGVESFVKNQSDAETAVNKLNQPVFEVVMTMHPTNTHSLESMQAQRELIKAVESGNTGKAKSAMRQLLSTPVLHEKAGQDANFTVRDETAVVVHFLNNLYEDLPAVYAEYDSALKNKFLTAYKPEKLNVKFRLGSWGSSGDKDGNQNVTAETTLEAIALHTQAIVQNYLRDVEAIANTALQPWKEKLSNAAGELKTLMPQIEALREDSENTRTDPPKASYSGKELSDRFDRLSENLRALREKLNAAEFTKDIDKLYADGKDPKILDLLRKVRTFGFDFAKIEYRETAEEYGRIAAEIIPGYAGKTAQDKVHTLTEILTTQADDVQYLVEAKKDEIVAAATKAYDKKDALPIAYHTLKRMQLARDFPAMIQDNVLAECGRFDDKKHHGQDEVIAQGTANMLEAKLMQAMVPEKSSRSVKLGIIPLFEEPDTMMNIDAIMRSAYGNPAYQQHLDLMKTQHGGKKTQQVQIAHSDNARRSGLLAARAYIHEAHKKMRALNKEMDIETQFFEGGSISDAYRNGVRAVSASVNAFDLHDFAKFTFQGGDLVNYFTAPSSTLRLLTRNIPHAAIRYEKDGDGWTIRNRTDEIPEAVPHEKRKPIQLLDDIAIAALKDTLADYQQHDFDKDKMGVMLAVLDYKGESTAGTRGSRAASRGAPVKSLAFNTGASIKLGRVKAAERLKGIEPVNIENVRTIAFSEAWQHAGIVPSWLGSKNLSRHLLAETKKHLDEIKSSTNPSVRNKFGSVTDETTELSPEQIQLFYERSPTFRDAQDRSAFAIAMTDPDSLEWIEKRLDLMQQMSGKPDNKVDPEMVVKGREYLAHVRETYDAAAELAHASLTGKALPGNAREAVGKALYRLSEDIQRKAHYRDFLLYAKIQGTDEHDRGVLHNAGDTVVHGRFLAADDPTYGEARSQKHSIGAAAVVAR